MQRQLVCLLVVGIAGFIVASVENLQDVGFDDQLSRLGELEQGNGLRKLLQEKPKAKTKSGDGLSGKAKRSGAGEKKSKAESGDGNHVEEKKVPAVNDAIQGGKLEGSELKPAAKKPGKTKKKILEDEDDEDIRFMEEEKLQSVVKQGGKKEQGAKVDGGEDVKEDGQGEVFKVEDEERTDAKTKVKKGKSKKAGAKKENVDVVLGDSENVAGDEKVSVAVEDDNVAEQKSVEEEKKQKKRNKKAPEVKVEALDDTDESSDSADADEKKGVEVEVIPDELDDVKVLEEEIPKKEVKKEIPKKTEKKDQVLAETQEEEQNSKPPTKISKKEKEMPKTKPKTAKEKPKLDKSSPTKAKKNSGESTKKSTEVKKKEEVTKDEKLEVPKTTTTTTTTTTVVNFPEEDLHTDAFDFQDELPDEEDIDLLSQISELPTKIQQTAGNVADTLRPSLSKLSETSKTYFSQANQQMTESFTPIMGHQAAPVVASLISYAFLLAPLIVVIYMLERIRATLSLAKVLFFVNLYLGAYFLTLVLATFALQSEPMAFFFRHSRSSCVFLQLLQALGYMLYLLLYTVAIMKSFSYGGVLERMTAVFQWVIVALFGLHYYVTVFHRAMAMKVPRTTWKVYLVYTAAFSVLALFARAKIEPIKKEYYYTPVDDSEEASPIDKRS
ncbi:transcriptional regulator ATRX homolog [Selaginella moellendorffii]|uniref:transcriptional regulator ATRX homolog n=1 Tax=Selaginella moellendorffii TaxID=88036 RepID=UPI000D1CB7ED|nr:transcriptional regulator ATRX homolog [Selaginella moellendorffii]XP_024535791.1 transcriptional regulator ATRX homolog [Selaginella moellendorffii]|eukprot:XP_024535790.1 transcriptional regulator ATRX homolog [Selaginella moellendorffii]